MGQFISKKPEKNQQVKTIEYCASCSWFHDQKKSMEMAKHDKTKQNAYAEVLRQIAICPCRQGKK